MSEPRDSWKAALATGSDCLPLERLGERLTPQEQAHVSNCARCSAEMALFAEMNREIRVDERAGVDFVAGRLEATSSRNNVVPLRPRLWRRAALAVAATIAVAVGLGSMMDREPAVEFGGGNSVYRSSRIDGLTPIGDVPAPPAQFRWEPVEGADSYEVVLSEVDETVVWRRVVNQPFASLDQAAAVHLVPGRTLRWEVTARRGTDAIASSGAQQFRIAVR